MIISILVGTVSKKFKIRSKGYTLEGVPPLKIICMIGTNKNIPATSNIPKTNKNNISFMKLAELGLNK